MTRTRTAAYVDAVGPTDTIKVGSLPVPDLGPTDVLVAVEVVTVNPVDTYIRSGRYRTPIPQPFILGRDLVGRVVETGPAVTGFAAGDRVWCNSLGHQGRQGSFTDLAIVPAVRLYRLPDGVDAELAVAVAHPAVTAYLGWFEHARVRPGWAVYVGGGAGNVGTAAIQMARKAGARVIAGARRTHRNRCMDAGADVVVDDRSAHLPDHILAAAPLGVQVYWDTSGTNDIATAAAALATGGRVLITAAREPDVRVEFGPLYTRDIVIDGFVLSRAPVEQLQDAAALINQMLNAGQLTTRLAGRLPLAKAAEAHRRIEAGRVDGRLLLRP